MLLSGVLTAGEGIEDEGELGLELDVESAAELRARLGIKGTGLFAGLCAGMGAGPGA